MSTMTAAVERIEQGPMAGLEVEPTDEEVTFSGVFLVRFEDDEVVGWRSYQEDLQVWQQLGVVPELDELVE